MKEGGFQNDVHQTNPLVDVPHFNTNTTSQMSQSCSSSLDDAKKPPSYPHNNPYSHSHSQPPFFNFDNLPPLIPLPSHLPPRKAHRRSNSDIPFSVHSLPPLVPTKTQARANYSESTQLVKEESDLNRDGKSSERKSQGEEVAEDMLSTYMNLDEKNIQENGDDLDSRGSGTKTDSSENEVESSMHMHGTKREGTKRNAADDTFPSTRHCRSLSMDSFMGNLPSFGGESLDATFSLEFANGEFNATELKKIMGNEKLAEIALIDPKRVKRILANRQSAARSKERKVRYISELEHKVKTLESEATTLAAQLTLLQRDSAGLTNQNNEFKFRLQAMEQQAHLRDALNEALSAEVKRLKLATGEYGGQVHNSNSSFPKQMVQIQHQQQQQREMSSSQTQDNISFTKPVSEQ